MSIALYPLSNDLITMCDVCQRATPHAAFPAAEEGGRQYLTIECRYCDTRRRIYLEPSLPPSDAECDEFSTGNSN